MALLGPGNPSKDISSILIVYVVHCTYVCSYDLHTTTIYLGSCSSSETNICLSLYYKELILFYANRYKVLERIQN